MRAALGRPRAPCRPSLVRRPSIFLASVCFPFGRIAFPSLSVQGLLSLFLSPSPAHGHWSDPPSLSDPSFLAHSSNRRRKESSLPIEGFCDSCSPSGLWNPKGFPGACRACLAGKGTRLAIVFLLMISDSLRSSLPLIWRWNGSWTVDGAKIFWFGLWILETGGGLVLDPVLLTISDSFFWSLFPFLHAIWWLYSVPRLKT